jgi:hypothetical protein
VLTKLQGIQIMVTIYKVIRESESVEMFSTHKFIDTFRIVSVDESGAHRYVDGRNSYSKKQSAYRRADRLNHPVKYAIKKTGMCEASWDNYNLVVAQEDEGYSLKIQIGGMPPHYTQDFLTVDAVEEEIRERSAMPLYLDWRAVEGE